MTKAQDKEREQLSEALQEQQEGPEASVPTVEVPQAPPAEVGYRFPAFEREELEEAIARADGSLGEGSWAVPATSNNIVLTSPKQPVGKVKGTTVVDAGPVDGHIRQYTLGEVKQMLDSLPKPKDDEE